MAYKDDEREEGTGLRGSLWYISGESDDEEEGGGPLPVEPEGEEGYE